MNGAQGCDVIGPLSEDEGRAEGLKLGSGWWHPSGEVFNEPVHTDSQS